MFFEDSVKVFKVLTTNSLAFMPASFNLIFSCCGAGTAADTEYTTQIISANIELHRLETQKKVCFYLNRKIVSI